MSRCCRSFGVELIPILFNVWMMLGVLLTYVYINRSMPQRTAKVQSHNWSTEFSACNSQLRVILYTYVSYSAELHCMMQQAHGVTWPYVTIIIIIVRPWLESLHRHSADSTMCLYGDCSRMRISVMACIWVENKKVEDALNQTVRNNSLF